MTPNQLIHKLGDSRYSIACTLHAMGIKGEQNNLDKSPLANYLSRCGIEVEKLIMGAVRYYPTPPGPFLVGLKIEGFGHAVRRFNTMFMQGGYRFLIKENDD